VFPLPEDLKEGNTLSQYFNAVCRLDIYLGGVLLALARHFERDSEDYLDFKEVVSNLKLLNWLAIAIHFNTPEIDLQVTLAGHSKLL